MVAFFIVGWFRRVVFASFSKQNNLPTYFLIKRLTDFSAKKNILGCRLKIFVHQLFGLYAIPSLRFGAASIPQLVSRKSLFSFYYAID
jgi:hypothetical protein